MRTETAAAGRTGQTSPAALSLRGVSRRFQSGERIVTVLDGLDLEMAPGERVAVMGASGSGKSTLLHLAAGMDRPDDGQIVLMGQRLDQLQEPGLTHFRARHVGLVFQDFNLIDTLNVRENIELPIWLGARPRDEATFDSLCRSLAIESLLDASPEQLSGGEKQRVAIARTLIHGPDLLLADEPTGSLDEDSAGKVLDLFDHITAERGCALVLVTHNPVAAAMCERRYQLRGGRLHTA